MSAPNDRHPPSLSWIITIIFEDGSVVKWRGPHPATLTFPPSGEDTTRRKDLSQSHHQLGVSLTHPLGTGTGRTVGHPTPKSSSHWTVPTHLGRVRQRATGVLQRYCCLAYAISAAIEKLERGATASQRCGRGLRRGIVAHGGLLHTLSTAGLHQIG